MRVALVSPYSWTYPGGVTRHIEALAGELPRAGHDVDVLAPFDPDDRRPRACIAGRGPQARAVPDWLVPLGRTIGWPSNGAVSNLGLTAIRRLRRCAASSSRAATTSSTCTSRSRRSSPGTP